MNGNSKLSSTELQFMEMIWNHPEGISSGDIYKQFPKAVSTKSTILRRIVKKGYVQSVQKGRQVYYYPKITKSEYQRRILESELEKKMGYASLGELMAAFCGKTSLTREQAIKLEKMVDELERGE